MEVALTFIITVLLIGGIIKIWLWSNNQIIKRQIKYNESRISAGTATDTYQLNWPVYQPNELTEGDVLLNGPLDNRCTGEDCPEEEE